MGKQYCLHKPMNKQDIDDWLVSMLSGFNLAIHFPHLKKKYTVFRQFRGYDEPSKNNIK